MMRRKLLCLSLVWLSFVAQAQTLNQQLIIAVRAGKYTEAKELIRKGANPNYRRKIFIKGHTRKSFLKDYGKVKSKSVGKGVAEGIIKGVMLPFVLFAEIVTPRKVADRNEYYSVLDYAIWQENTPQKHAFVRWLFNKGGRKVHWRNQRAGLVACALEGQNLAFIDKLLKSNYSPRIIINKCGSGLNYVLKNYPADQKLAACKLLLRYGASPLRVYGNYPTPLALAAKVQNKPVLQLFSQYIGPDELKKHKRPKELIGQITSLGDTLMIQALVDKGFEWHQVNVLYEVLTHSKLSYEHKKRWLQYFTRLGLHTNPKNQKKYAEISTFLYQIIQYKSYFNYNQRHELLKYLLDQGANPLLQPFGYTTDPLSLCITKSNTANIKLFLNYCKPADIKSVKANHVALVAHYHNLDLVQQFMQMGFDWQKPLPEKTNPLYVYMLKRNPLPEATSIKLLEQFLPTNTNLNLPVRYDAQDPFYNTGREFHNPLSLLYQTYQKKPNDSIHRYPFYKKAERLMKQGANPLLNHGKGSALDRAIRNRDWGALRFFVERLTKENVAEGNTNPIGVILSQASFHPQYVQMLIAKGVNWREQAQQGKMLIEYLLERDYNAQRNEEKNKLLEYFLKNGASLPQVISRKAKAFMDDSYELFCPLGVVLKSYKGYLSHPKEIEAFVQKAKVLVTYGANPLAKEGLTKSALEIAIDLRAMSVIKLFLDQVTPQQVAQSKTTLAYAMRSSKKTLSSEIIRLLIEKGLPWDKNNTFRDDLIASEAQAQDHAKEYIATLGHLLRNGANPNQLIYNKYTLLTKVMRKYRKPSSRMSGTKRYYKMLQSFIDTLLHYGANPMIKTESITPKSLNQDQYYTALQWGIERKDHRLLKKLLTNISTEQVQKAEAFNLRLACERSTWEIVLLLIEKGFDWKNFLNLSNGNVLHSILSHPYKIMDTRQALKYFLSQGVAVNHLDVFDTSPLMYLIEKRPTALELTRLLLKYGADLKQQKQGSNVIEQAVFWMNRRPEAKDAYKKLIRLLKKSWKKRYKVVYPKS